ncbi:DNA-binding transcriptional regulator YhcF (GntR family) [Arcanobacterium wilhelmae]|uniref:DNA-binding transcriptional regulator YhcF (GntR family) n=1 Tax=Arcanobacterium wilhelmae TaxID=1803177 RepID=A0ABT9N9N3_9ACTO|nr:GntR family transcriptional regulator [Arcanobacterium wilhelmae]MDP9800423.1 DNA-binding transcriptional regulator YhcF (GntR family) [Arcanobacterium wilhelmae]
MITIDPQLPAPPYEQLKQHIAAQRAEINSRVPEPAEDDSVRRLPPVRRLALELGLATGTVARAYKELERDSIVATRGRYGTYLTTSDAVRSESPEKLATEFATAARTSGLTQEQAISLIRAAFNA